MDQWQGKAYSASFGSSHVHYGFDPRVFDKVLAGTPAQTRTINLGMAGGSQTEQRVTALEFLRRMKAPQKGAGPGAARACIVVLELEAGTNFTTEHLVHPRAINIYDWQTMRFVVRLAPKDLGVTRRFGRTGFAVIAMGMHYLNVGMLSSEFFALSVDQSVVTRDTGHGGYAQASGLRREQRGHEPVRSGVFKYFHFFVGSAVYFAQELRFHLSEPTLRIILPVGVSFFTFQSLSYTIDVYRREIRLCRNCAII